MLQHAANDAIMETLTSPREELPVPPLRALVADDDDGVRSALAEVLDADPRFSVVGVATTGDELLTLADTLHPDVVLLDVRMPGGGAPAARALLAGPAASRVPDASGQRSLPPVVVAVSAHTGTSVVVSMVRAGASGYLAKGRLGSLPDLVARCAEGEVVIAVPSAAEALRQIVDGDARDGVPEPPRERR